MLGKAFSFLGRSIIWGIVAFLLALIFSIMIGLLLGITLIPLDIITKGGIEIISTSFGNWGFRTIFVILFLEMMLRNYNKPGLEERLKNFVRQEEEDWE